MLPRWKIILTVSLLLSLMNIAAPVLADPIDGVVGTGTAVSCTSAAGLDDLQDEINDGGVVTFNCGAAPVTIPVTTTLEADAEVGVINATLDGGGLITLDGQNARRIFFQRTYFNNSSTLTLQNLTLTGGRVSGSGVAANGSAILSRFEAAQPSLKPILNIDNVTFSNNVSNLTSAASGDFGGAIFSQGGFVNVTDSTFSSNTATGGSAAAIHILQSGLTVDNTTFTNNIATNQGGAIYIDGLGGASGVFSLTNSSFTGNRSHFSGGAIYVNMYENTTQFIVDRTSFIDNGVNGGDRAQGGAIAGGSTTSGGGTGNAIIRITNSLFSENFVDRPGTADGSGGAINFNQQAQVTIANSTFDGNRAEGNSFGANGGAIVIINNTTQFQIINSTISNNFAGWVGGAIASSSNGRLRNTIIAYNTADNGGNTWDIGQHCSTELVEDGTNLQYPPRNNNPNTGNETTCFVGKSAINQRNLPDFRDPLLNPLANNGGPTWTRNLQSTSPAIDYGSNVTCAAAPVNNVDQRGQARPTDGDGLNGAQCDVGAFEFVSNQPPFAPTLSLPAPAAQLTGTFTVFTWQPAPFATTYRLQVDDDANFSSPVVDETLTGTSFIPAYVGVGTFSWKVEAINGNGNEESVVRTFTLNSAGNAIPTRNFTAATSQTLTWSPLTWAIGYQVEIAADAGFTDIVDISAVLPASADSYTASLDPGIYYWRVKGRKADLSFGSPSAAEMLTVGSG